MSLGRQTEEVPVCFDFHWSSQLIESGIWLLFPSWSSLFRVLIKLLEHSKDADKDWIKKGGVLGMTKSRQTQRGCCQSKKQTVIEDQCAKRSREDWCFVDFG